MVPKPAAFKCDKCGNEYEKPYAAGDGVPECCGQPLREMEAQTGNPDEQKHVPFIVRQEDGILVKVGKNAPHPMDPDHYIVFIEICADEILMRKYLNPGDRPEAFFPVKAYQVVAWEYCNKHGLWKSRRSVYRRSRAVRTVES